MRSAGSGVWVLMYSVERDEDSGFFPAVKWSGRRWRLGFQKEDELWMLPLRQFEKLLH